MSESAVSAKRGWGQFGVKPVQSETPVRAARLSGAHLEEGEVRKRRRSLPCETVYGLTKERLVRKGLCWAVAIFEKVVGLRAEGSMREGAKSGIIVRCVQIMASWPG